MRRPPRKRQDDIITKPLVMRVLSSGLLILIGKLTRQVGNNGRRGRGERKGKERKERKEG